jgi:tight adherence protein C
MTLAGLDANAAITLMASMVAFVSVIGIALPMLRRERRAARVRAVLRDRFDPGAERNERVEAARRRRESAKVGAMRAVLDRLKLRGGTATRSLRTRLARAGWRGPAPLVTYAFAQVATPLAAAFLAGLVAFGADRPDVSATLKAAATVAAAAIGYLLPRVVLANAIQRRQQELRRGFPDALDLIVLCVEAGLSLDAAFGRVAKEMEDTAPVLAEEFGLVSAELALLADRRAAFLNLAERTGLEDFKSLVTALVQAEKYGTSLGTILRVLARENREQRMLRAENKAGRLPAILTVPMITFFMPSLFIVLLGPAVIQTIRAFQ